MMGFTFLGNQRHAKTVFEATLNSIGYIIIFMLFSWDKIYYVMKKEGNDSNKYFKITVYKKCFKHNSLTCGCRLEVSDEDNQEIIKKFIIFYKYCSLMIVYRDGKIKYVNSKYKLSILDS